MMCERKVAFDTKEEAAATNQQVYLCPYCGKYHRSAKFQKFVAKLKRKAGKS
jgi:hypothetical protein